MKVNQEKCIGCAICLPFCPANAISIIDKKALINQELCFECGNCLRTNVVKCPTKSFYEPEENTEGVRSFRRFFSDPATTHKMTGVPGRGTEEVKTNDVTGRVSLGEVGIGVELGRPVIGTNVKDLEKVCMEIAKHGVVYEENNPLIHLMSNPVTGKFKDEFMDEIYLSAIVEFSIPVEKMEEIINVIIKVANEIDTVFSLDLISCFDENQNLRVFPILEKIGIKPRMNSKINLGLGRPLAVNKKKAGV